MVEPHYRYSVINMQDYEGLQAVDRYSTLEYHKPPEWTSSSPHPQVVDHGSPALALDPSENPHKTTIEPHYAAVRGDDLITPGPSTNEKPAKRYCGLTKRACILVSVAIIIIVATALGVGLGVALGGRSKSQGSASAGSQSAGSNDTSTASSYTARSKSGFAVIKAGDSTGNAYAYYQGKLGAIRELVWQNSQWVAQSSTSDIVVAAQSVMDSTPITATSYADPSGLMRLVFYFNKQGQLMMVNRTSAGPWTSPLNVVTDTVVRSTNIVALDCFTTGYNGLRVSFASSEFGMRWAGLNGAIFGNGTWNGQSAPGFSISDTVDPDSGVGMHAYASTSQMFTRNNVSGGLNLWYTIYNMTTGAPQGYRFNSTSTPLVAPGSSISACSTGLAGATVSIFYQTTDGSVVQVYSSTVPAQPPPDGSRISLDTDYRIVGQVPVGTKFRAVYNAASAKGAYISSIGAGPMVYFQLDGSPGISYIKIAPDGSSITPGILAG